MGGLTAPEVSAFSGFVCGILVGAVAYAIGSRPRNPYSEWLGRECWVRSTRGGGWKRHTIVAVSWKGAVCVRDAERMDLDGYWIKKQNVRRRVRFEEPEVGE